MSLIYGVLAELDVASATPAVGSRGRLIRLPENTLANKFTEISSIPIKRDGNQIGKVLDTYVEDGHLMFVGELNTDVDIERDTPLPCSLHFSDVLVDNMRSSVWQINDCKINAVTLGVKNIWPKALATVEPKRDS